MIPNVAAPQLTPQRRLESQDFVLSVAQGIVPGHSIVEKFGENPDVDSGSVPEEVWDQGGVYIYDADGTAPIVSLISDNAGDTQDIEVQGLDIDGLLVVQTLTLTGTSRVALTTPLWRVFRMKNLSSTDIAGTVYCYIGTGGVPASSNIRAAIEGDNNQTLMAIYTIPADKVGFIFNAEVAITRNPTSGSARARLRQRAFGGVFQAKKLAFVAQQGTSVNQFDKRWSAIPGKTDIHVRVDSVSSNNTGISGTFDILLVDSNLFPPEYLADIGQP